jgi:hypothetical protein
MQRALCPRHVLFTLAAARISLVLAWPDCAAAQDRLLLDSFQLTPGVIVDRNRNQLYLMSPEHFIMAVDIRNGKESWRTQAAAKPLTVAGNYLVGQAEAADSVSKLDIVVLELKESGEMPVFAGERRLELPTGVASVIGPNEQSWFTASGRPMGRETAVLSWEYSPGLKSGTQFAPPTVRPPNQGAFLLNLQSGKVEDLDPKRKAYLDREHKTSPVAPLTRLPPAERFADAPDPNLLFLSADGRHVLSSERVSNEAVWDNYRWTIYDRNERKRLGVIRSYLAVAPFFVLVSQDQDTPIVVYQASIYEKRTQAGVTTEPLRIEAVRTQKEDSGPGTSQILWSQPLRDTIFRGPNPPRVKRVNN